MINEITKWVITHVVEQIKRWQNEGVSMKVAINVSSKDLRDGTIVDFLRKTIEENALEPSSIEFELTERSILYNVENAKQCLNQLRSYGVEIALDDFGTGYNSLLDLITIPTDYLKIDKAFIDNIFNIDNATIFESIVVFAHKTGKKVIAEGVETREQFDKLQRLYCDYIQGYFISKPLMPEKIKVLQQRNSNIIRNADNQKNSRFL